MPSRARGMDPEGPKRREAAPVEWGAMVKLLLFLLLLVVCWPLALLALLLYPLVWLLSIPFRLVGIAVDGVLELVKAVILLPARILSLGKGKA